MYIAYQIVIRSRQLNIGFTPGKYLLGATRLTENVDPDKYGFTGYSIVFHACSIIFMARQ